MHSLGIFAGEKRPSFNQKETKGDWVE